MRTTMEDQPIRHTVSKLQAGDHISVDGNVLCVDHIARWEGFGREHAFLIAVLKKRDGSFMGCAWKEEEQVSLVSPKVSPKVSSSAHHSGVPWRNYSAPRAVVRSHDN